MFPSLSTQPEGNRLAQETVAEIFSRFGINILKYDPSKARCVTTASGGTTSLEKYAQKVQQTLGPAIAKHPELMESVFDMRKFKDLITAYTKEEGTFKDSSERVVVIPDSYKGLTLNLDQTHSGQTAKFFMTTSNELVSSVSGNTYLSVCGIPDEDAFRMARKVVPEYLPRSPRGVSTMVSPAGEVLDTFNMYIPPKWTTVDDPVPDKLPKLFDKLVRHLFPIEEEREYFYSWLHYSLFDRAYVYLVLCGVGGAGKNTLKKVLRALHGHSNSVDGKRSSLKERFNSQLENSTLAWFDELSYDIEMENVMKEIQNDTISIERKGVDTTRSTKIYASSIISNNKPRDNFIAFDARKFVPLVVANKRLETSMTEEEIDTLVKKVEDQTSDTFDPKFLKQIALWVKKHGKSRRWKNLEYRGPMFYKLAHTSMSRWQKVAVQMVVNLQPGGRVQHDPKRGYLWSTAEEAYARSKKGFQVTFPEYSTVKYLFDIFVDAKGKKIFETTQIAEDVMGDFWVRPIAKSFKLLTEMEVVQDIRGENGEEEIQEEEFDPL